MSHFIVWKHFWVSCCYKELMYGMMDERMDRHKNGGQMAGWMKAQKWWMDPTIYK